VTKVKSGPVKFLITGGAGFVGSHLADELLGRGHHVHVLDDLSTGAIENVRHLKEHVGFQYTIDSCSNEGVVAELVDGADSILHLAAAVGVRLIVESPAQTIETNVRCTELVLARAAKKKRPVFLASTSEVYGKSRAVPFRESGDLVMGPTNLGRWSYACSKAIDEFLALAYHAERALPVIIGRLFNTVGPRQTGRYGMVVPTFARQAVLNAPITVFGDGRQQRCFCHVKDVVRAIADLMERGDLYGEVFNIGSTEEVTIRQLAERVRELAGSRSEIVTIPYDEAYGGGFEDMYRRVPDTTKLERAIGWQRTRDLDEILGDVLASTRLALAADRERRAGLRDRRRTVVAVSVERRAGPADRRLAPARSRTAAAVPAYGPVS
jgi:UDP-glucose 4-epimerase